MSMSRTSKILSHKQRYGCTPLHYRMAGYVREPHQNSANYNDIRFRDSEIPKMMFALILNGASFHEKDK